MRRWSFFVYGVFSYLLFFVTYAYLAGFVGDFLVPKSINGPTSINSSPAGMLQGVVIDVLLVVLFGLQHSIMARPWFKAWWTRFVPPAIERSTYVLLSCVFTILLMWQWHGLDATIWDVQNPLARNFLWVMFAAGWLMVPTVSLMINHFDLFGVRQVWLSLRGLPYTSLAFRTPYLYGHVRHPLYVGWALAFWATPTMTLGHLLLAVTMTLYMAIAVRFEERDLVSYFGDAYLAYRRRVPMVFPRFGKEVESMEEIPVAPKPAHSETVA